MSLRVDKMYLHLKENVMLHWWGDSIVLVYRMTDWYYLSIEEVLFFSEAEKNNNIAEIKKAIATMVGEKETSEEFVATIIYNFSDYFFLSDDDEELNYSGKKGYYLPYELSISLTNRCPHSCVHCYKGAGPDERNSVDISTIRLQAFLQKAMQYVPYISFTGGDSVCHHDIVPFIKTVSGSSHITILTSGYYLNNVVLSSIIEAHATVNVSVYSSNKKTHDSFVRLSGSFDHIMSNIDKCINNGVQVAVSTLLTNENLNDVKSLIEQMHERGVSCFSIGTISPVGRAKNGPIEWVVPKKQYVSYINDLKKSFPHLVINTFEKMDTISIPFSPFKCFAGSFSWSIFEDGSIGPCGVYYNKQFKIGSIDDDFLVLGAIMPRYYECIKQSICGKEFIDKNNDCIFESIQ